MMSVVCHPALPPVAAFAPDKTRPRGEQLRAWLDSDPDIRAGLTSLGPGLAALAARVDKWERFAIGFKDRV